MGTSTTRYTAEFKTEAVRQVIERGHPVREVAARLGVSAWSLHQWVRLHREGKAPGKPAPDDQAAEIRRLKAELRRVTEERDILKRGHGVLRQAVGVRYAFIREQQAQYPVRRLCQMMRVHPSGYYAWLERPHSRRHREDEVLLGHIKHAWLESGGVYGYRKIQTDLLELGIECGKHRVHRLMRREGLRSQTGYRRRPAPRGGRPSVIAPNRLQQQFSVAEPNRAWVTDISYIRTHEGWLYLAVVLDRFSRQVIGWSMQTRIDRELVLDALLMAVWRRQPRQEVIVHSDQGSQFGSTTGRPS